MKFCFIQFNAGWHEQVILEKRRFASIFGSGMEFSWKEVGGADFLQQLVIQCNAFQVCSLCFSKLATEESIISETITHVSFCF